MFVNVNIMLAGFGFASPSNFLIFESDILMLASNSHSVARIYRLHIVPGIEKCTLFIVTLSSLGNLLSLVRSSFKLLHMLKFVIVLLQKEYLFIETIEHFKEFFYFILIYIFFKGE